MSIWQSMAGFDGRIARKYFWLANLVLMVAWLVIFGILIHWLSGGQWLDEKYFETQQGARVTSVVAMIGFVVFLYPSLAVWIKRLHDLDRSGWWSVPTFVLGVLHPLAQVAGQTCPPDAENLLGNVLFWGNLVVAFVYLIILGFFSGTVGPNGYGQDPLRRTPASVGGI